MSFGPFTPLRLGALLLQALERGLPQLRNPVALLRQREMISVANIDIFFHPYPADRADVLEDTFIVARPSVRNYRPGLELDLVFSQQVAIMLRGVIRLRHLCVNTCEKESTWDCCVLEVNQVEGPTTRAAGRQSLQLTIWRVL